MNGDEHLQTPSESSEDVRGAEQEQADETRRKTGGRPSRKTSNEKAPRQIRRHSPEERADKLRRIEQSLEKGGVSLKAAVEAVGISDQTYYQWKRAEKPEDVSTSTEPKASQPKASQPSLGNELADLIKLEEENQRLRQLLGEKLRAENAELRRRLEMD